MGWVDILDLLLKYTGPDILDHFYHSPTWFDTILSAAATTGEGRVIRYLLENGADARCHADSDNAFKLYWSLFHYLFLLNEDEDIAGIASLLLEHGADPNSIFESPYSINTLIGKEFPIDIAGTPLDIAVRVGDLRTVRTLLRCGGDPLLYCPVTRSIFTHSPLQLAVALYEFDIVELFLDHLHEHDRLSDIRLHHINGSIFGGKDLMARWLLHGSGAMIAIDKTIEPADVGQHARSILTPDGRSALALCSHNLVDLDNAGAVDILIKAGAEIDYQGNFSYAAAHWLAETNATAALRVLLDAGASTELKLHYGVTLLYLAIQECSFKAAKFLITHGALANNYYPIETTNALRNLSALEIAVVGRQVNIIHELLKRNASIYQENNLGTILHHAINGFSLDIVRILLDTYRHLFCLPEVLPNLDMARNSPLHSAAICNSPLFAHELLLAGADIDFIDPVGEWKRTAVALAAEYGSFKTLVSLLEAGASPYCRAERRHLRDDTADPRWSFLHETMYHVEKNELEPRFEGSIFITRPWMEKCGILNSHDMDGWSVLHYAIYRGRVTCVKALLEAGASLDDVVRELSESEQCQRWKGRSGFEFALMLRAEGRFWTDEDIREEIDAWPERMEKFIAYLEEYRSSKAVEKQTDGIKL